MAGDEAKPEEAAPAADSEAKPAGGNSEGGGADESAAASAPSSDAKRQKRSNLDALTADSVKVPTSTKRQRKTVDRLEAANFADKKGFECPEGRGTALSEIEVVTENIKGAKMKGALLMNAHKFVFGGRAKDRERKSQLLQFSGYLPPKQDGIDEEEQAKIDEDAETKMSEKAYKLTIPALRDLCDFFDVDRSAKPGKPVDKDALVDRLLDFLGAPDKKMTKTYLKSKKAKSRKSATAAKAVKKKSDEGDDDTEEEEEDEAVEAMEVDEDGKKVPTDKALRKWVRAYVNCFNLDKATTKHALETASDKFGVDLAGKKGRIKELLTEEMMK